MRGWRRCRVVLPAVLAILSLGAPTHGAPSFGVGVPGAEIPACEALEVFHEESCDEISDRYGLESSELREGSGLIGVGVDVEVVEATDLVESGGDDEGPDCLEDLAKAADCLDAGSQVSSSGFGAAFGVKYQATRECKGSASNGSYVTGVNHRYKPDPPPNHNKRWRLWTQKHTAVPKGGWKLVSVAHSIKAENAGIHDYDAASVDEVAAPRTYSLGVSASVGGTGFGVSGTWSQVPDYAGGYPNSGLTKHTSVWYGKKTTNPKAAMGAQIWKIPKQENGGFAIRCMAAFVT